jgi:hypothetical protein
MVAVEASSKRRLARACKHVGDLWFPASPSLLKEIRLKLNQGVYDHDPMVLYNDVRSDFSLFMYMLRKLASMVRYEDGIERVATPQELFSRVGLVRLKEALDLDDSVLSRHSLEQITRAQSCRIEEAFVSASAVESLSAPLGFNPEGGFALALFRQLGLTLVAFNYPSLYEEVISSLGPNEDVESKLASHLGFTPSILAVTLFREVGVEPHFFDVMPERISLDLEEVEVGLTLSRLCEVGEALARANNPERYPSASKDWKEAKSVIEGTLGSQGLTIIRSILKKNLLKFAKSSPNVFKTGVSFNPEAKLWKIWEERHKDVNNFLDGCSKEFQRPLHQFYDRIIGKQVPQDAIGILIKEVFPVAGFQGGCVYTVDPVTRMFYPQLRINQVDLRILEPIPFDNTGDPVASAFSSDLPVVGADSNDSGTLVNYMAGVLGGSQKIAVLYVEMLQRDYIEDSARYVAHLQALCKALSDTLLRTTL